LNNFLSRLGGEERGIERVLPHERTDQHPYDNFSVWMSANLTVSTFSLGTLGPGLFFLGWWDSFLAIFFFNMIGMIPPAYYATFGPKTGLRAMTIPRFSFGWYGAMLVAFANVIACMGWSMVNSIVGGQVIAELSDGKCPLVVGVILIAIVSLIVALLGYKFVHHFERFSWVVMIILFCIVAGLGAKHFVNVPWGSGSGEAASVLSFGGAIFGFAVAWISLTPDYNVNMKEDIPRWKVFFWTYSGLFMSLNFIEWLGAACMVATTANPEWADAYKHGSVGGLIGAVLAPVGGFGKFCLVLLAFSIVANNIPNNYSLGLSAQVLGKWALKVPRFLWTFIGVVVYVIAAVAGRDHFATILDSFLLCMGYWLTPFFVVIFEEHLIFRRQKYNLEDWANLKALPVGIAALTSFGAGVVLAVMGMSQEWYVGPLALKAGPAPFGADIGFELGFGTTALLYPLLRHFERKKFGR